MKDKTSLFQRFMSWTKLDRLRNGKSRGSRNGTADGLEDCALAVAELEAFDGEPVTELPAPVRVERMSVKEETILRLREGFRDMSDLLGDINENIRDQAQASKGIHEKIEVLPELLAESRAGNHMGEKMMGGLLQEVAEAGLRQKEALQNLRSLPVALAAIQENEIAQYKALAAIKDELMKRTALEREMADSFKKFDTTLDKLGDSTLEQAKQIEALGATQKEMATGFHKVQAKTLEGFQLSQERTLDEFRSAQAQLLHTVQQSQERMRRKLVWSIGIVAAVLGFLAIIIFGLWGRAVSDLSQGHKDVERRAAAIEERAATLLKERDREIATLRAEMESKKGAKDFSSAFKDWGKD